MGLLYGPSGCGKSSLVKAGLLPHLAGHVVPVYVECSAGDTEARLLRALRKRCPGVPEDRDLTATLAACRQGPGRGRKVLLVLDQFEQFLHARRGEPAGELAEALRQCDGERVQALLLVRDDFGMAVTRLMAALDIPIVQGQNFAAVDLFDPDHARRVLAEFGRAFGRLPPGQEPPGRDEDAFLKQAVAGLGQDGRVVPVRLALFAETVKARPWSPATLKAVGGAQGVGVAFLEETFGPRAAQPRCRFHGQAAQAMLKAQLPDAGSDIKGNVQSHAKLLEASGYAKRPKDFEDLLRLLDGELRLLTPAEPPGGEADGGRYYQLTHDYLVPALRAWLTRKQRETWRGRAELRLTERAALWAARPESRYLPPFWEWTNIRLFTRRRDWTPPQRRMMRKAVRFHARAYAQMSVLVACFLVLPLLLAALWLRAAGFEQRNREHAADLVKRLLGADAREVLADIADIGNYRQWADPLLRDANAHAADGSPKKLYSSLALLPVDPDQQEYLYGQLTQPRATPQEVLLIRTALEAHKEHSSTACGAWRRTPGRIAGSGSARPAPWRASTPTARAGPRSADPWPVPWWISPPPRWACGSMPSARPVPRCKSR